MPTRSIAISVFLGTWSLGLTVSVVGMLVLFLGQGRGSPWLLVPFVFGAAAMLACAVSLMRWNLKGEEHIEVSAQQLHYSRVHHPVSNRVACYTDLRAFEFSRPHPYGIPPTDFQIWRMGAWSLALLTASGDKIELVKRLTKHDAGVVAEALRSVGYPVIGLEH